MGHRMRLWMTGAGFVVAVLSLSVLALQPEPETRTARTSAVGDPVAVIAWLPPEVSNGTWSSLDGTQSSDPDGMIVNYTWRIEVANVTTELWGQTESYKFKTLGLYKISLTVTDDSGSSDTAFTAVYSIIDVDRDGLPDWWEMHYLLTMEEIGSDDFDNDGYTNLEEYASGLDPTVQNSHPGFIQDIKDNWMVVLAAAAVIVVVAFLVGRELKKKRKQLERKKIEFAIEIEKALQEEK